MREVENECEWMVLRGCTVDPRQEVLDDGSDTATETSQKKGNRNDQSTALGTFSKEEARGGGKKKGGERNETVLVGPKWCQVEEKKEGAGYLGFITTISLPSGGCQRETLRAQA